MCENCDYQAEANGPDPADPDFDGLGPPLSMDDAEYGWCSERECPYRINPHEEDGYEEREG